MRLRASVVLAGLIGVAVCAAAGCGAEGGPVGLDRANLIIISIDTVRADALGIGGGADDVSPFLDAFAEECVVFDHARAPAPETAPSHMSLFTSVYPSVHGVQNIVQGVDPSAAGTPEEGRRVPIVHPLPATIPTLAEVLSSAGFTTIALTDGGNLTQAHGFDRGFDLYTKDLTGVDAQVRDAELWLADRRRPLPGQDGRAQLADSVAPVESRWINRLVQARFGEEPAGRFFLFWHTYEAHAPYVPPQEYIDRWAPRAYTGFMRPVVDGLAGLSFRDKWSRMKDVFWKRRDEFGEAEARFLRGLYDGGIRYTDDTLPRLMRALAESGELERSVLVICSDHGEEFHEHGRWQHEQLYEECLRVPLMVRLPGAWGGGRRIATPVSLMDVMPTVLELLGVRDERVRPQGRSLADALLDGGEPKAMPVTSEYRADHPGNPIHEWQVAHMFQGLKLIQDEVRGRRVDGEVVYDHRLFDLRADPAETLDVKERLPERLHFFRELHKAWGAAVAERTGALPDASRGEMDEATRQQLIELGYIDPN